MNCLVLSAGGMYGAYQAGAWKELCDVFEPDLVVGASIGAVNGWAIAGGCDPDELIRRWLNLPGDGGYRWKLPKTIFGGVLNIEPLARAIRDIYESFQPKIEFALVVTDLLKLRPRIFRGREVTADHLLASTAIIGLFDQVRLEGRLCSDGGLLAAVPLWAAAELGATRALVIDVLPAVPGVVAKVVVGAMRSLSSFRAVVPAELEVIRVAPPALLGPPLDSLRWKRKNVEAWVEAGRREAARVKHSIANCFERK